MTIKRKLVDIYTPAGEPGFLGPGHIARRVIQRGFSGSDPFIMLMDDVLDKRDNNPSGGPHPHAGFETVTLMLEGSLGVGTHSMEPGDLQLMTAGSGVVHTETIDKPVKMRILQLWLSLPKGERWAPPRLQDMPNTSVPMRNVNGVSMKVYSGSFGGLTSPLQNYAPFILADVALEPGVATTQQLPANYNTFIYMLDGSVNLGQDEQMLSQGNVGWLDLNDENVQSELSVEAGAQGARFVLYAGKPTGDTIYSHGPFIGDNAKDISRLFHEYHLGNMKDISLVPGSQKIVY
jgi:redox-sensitive bicupin YhaK (pirin superfamily)